MLALHLLLVAVLLGTGVAGWWQLGAWRAERSDAVAERSGREPVSLAAVLGPDDPLTNEDLGVPVVVDGRYAPRDQQFLVSGRDRDTEAGEGGDGTAGYWALSPLEVDDTGSSLLVVRGWQPVASPLPPVPAGEVRETGVLLPGEEGSGAPSAGRVVGSIRIPALVGETPTDLYGGYLLRTGAAPADPAGLAPVAPPELDVSWSTGLRNLAYGAQWWMFGGFAVVMWWRMCVDRVGRG